MARLGDLFNGCLALQDPRMWGELRQLARAGAMPLAFDLVAQSVYAAPSSRHGQGAFAATALAHGTVASLYPVHSIGVGTQRIHADGDSEYWREPCTTAYRSNIFHSATPGAPDAGPITQWAPGAYVDANPTRECLPGWMAHLANDVAVCTGSQEEEVLRYYAAGAAEANCVMLPFGSAAPLMALVTTRDVAADEELLLSYGHSYWLDAFGVAAAPPTPAVMQAAARMWGEGLDAMVGRLSRAYATDVRLLEGILAKR